MQSSAGAARIWGGVLAGLLAWLVLGAESLTAQESGGTYLQLELEGEVWRAGDAERTPIARWQALTTLRRAGSDPAVRGLWIDLVQSPSLADAQELRELVATLRASGREVLVHCAGGTDTVGYFLASAGSTIVLSPFATLELVGLGLEATFLREGLQKAGLTADVWRSDAYVAAAEMLTRDSMSESFREVSDSILDGFYRELVQAIAAGRSTTVEQVRAWIDEGPYTAAEAAAASRRLIDGVAHRDELLQKLRNRTAADLDLVDLARYERTSAPTLVRPERIALVHIAGLLVTGNSRRDAALGELQGARSLTNLLREIRGTTGVRAVVLRIDSPGGSLLAADLVRREVALLAEVKPVVVSFGARGGGAAYFIAAPAQHILALPTTLTGSLGLLMGHVHFEPWLEKLGVRRERVTRGHRADSAISNAPTAVLERRRAQLRLESQYRLAMAQIAADRRLHPKLSPEYVDSVGKGRMWTGRQALEFRLVDELGGLDRALAKAQELAGLSIESVVPLAPISEADDWWGRFREIVGSRVAIEVPIEDLWEGPVAALGLFGWVGGEGPYMMHPLDLRIR